MREKKIGCAGCGTTLSSAPMTNLTVKGHPIWISGLDDMMGRVLRRRLQSRKEVREELHIQLPQLCQVPAGEEDDYVAALMDEYDRRLAALN
ncbi:MAG: hypothetical protein WCK39_07085 [Methanomassiliicoccales archaeon]